MQVPKSSAITLPEYDTWIPITFSRISVQLSIHLVQNQVAERQLELHSAWATRKFVAGQAIIARPPRKVWTTAAAGDKTVIFACRPMSTLPQFSLIPIS